LVVLEIPDSDKITAVLTARVHPGETNSSWVILGLLRFLTGTSKEAIALRKQFVFRIIPMLNPDGVILGNYRCSVTGSDLNRNYRHPRKDAFPTVWHTRALVQLSQISSRAPDKFNFSGCRFSIHPSKEATGRVVFWREFEISHSFTLETTFNGSELSGSDLRQFDTADFIDMGRQIGISLLQFCSVLNSPNLLRNTKSKMAREIFCNLLRTRGSTRQLPLSFQVKRGDWVLPESGNSQNKQETEKSNDQGRLAPQSPEGQLLALLATTTKSSQRENEENGRQQSEDQTYTADHIIEAIPTSTTLEEFSEAIRWLEQERGQSTDGRSLTNTEMEPSR
ncbi:hypothetical protein EG68_06985, partial [Paragonimus skrjabini miyazakii]